MLKIQQAWQGQRHIFSQFRAKLIKLKNLNGKTIPPSFQTLDSQRLYKVLCPEFSARFSKPKSALNKKNVPRETFFFFHASFIWHSYPKIF